jgi:hypothetical protein
MWRPPGRFWNLFGALMPKCAPFWAPLDFEGVPKLSNFLENQHKVWKNYDQERFQKKHQNLIDFRCQNKRHEKVEKLFSHDTCCVLRGFAGSRNSMKNGRTNVMKNPWKLTHWVPLGWIVEILGGFWKTSNSTFFMIFSIDPKINKNLQQIQKWGESDAKGGARLLPQDWEAPRGRFTGP